jgi:hypothetical protein
MNRLPQSSWIRDDDGLNEEVLEAIQVGQNKS